MKKFVVRFSLSLCILLLSGYSQLHAHAHRDCIENASTELSEESGDANGGVAQKRLAWFKKSSKSNREKRVFKIYHATEVEEEEDGESESVTLKRNSGSSNYFDAIFSTQVPGDFFSRGTGTLLFCKHFSSSLYKRYLILQVFRL